METNIFIEGNNADVMRGMPDESIDLIYADPPFNTGRDFGEFSDKPRDIPEIYPYTDLQESWLSDVCTPQQLLYFKSVVPVVEQCHRVLKRSGAIYWHCDYKTSHVMRLIFNEVFGQPQFRNDIAWEYQISMPFNTIKNLWKNNYDNILFYAKPEHDFTPQFHKLTYKEIKENYPYTDSKGRKYRYTDGLYGNRQYADENKGKRIGTAWTDIPRASLKERTGYPTQKPVVLLKRIVAASSKEGEIVLDPYCGSGTTCVAAKLLKRQYIGIDESPEAIHTAKERTK